MYSDKNSLPNRGAGFLKRLLSEHAKKTPAALAGVRGEILRANGFPLPGQIILAISYIVVRTSLAAFPTGA